MSFYLPLSHLKIENIKCKLQNGNNEKQKENFD